MVGKVSVFLVFETPRLQAFCCGTLLFCLIVYYEKFLRPCLFDVLNLASGFFFIHEPHSDCQFHQTVQGLDTPAWSDAQIQTPEDQIFQILGSFFLEGLKYLNCQVGVGGMDGQGQGWVLFAELQEFQGPFPV